MAQGFRRTRVSLLPPVLHWNGMWPEVQAEVAVCF
jgi:hypothetical protein